MVNNVKGRFELKGFRALGVVLEFCGNDVEEGIRLYEASTINGNDVKKYGLEESDYDLWRGSTKVAGKKLLRIHTAALQHMFGDVSISGYASLWKVGGAVDKKAELADSIAHESAVTHFRDSLNVRQRQGGGDGGHQQMLDDMLHCIDRLDGRRLKMCKDDKVSCSTCPLSCVCVCVCAGVCVFVCVYVCVCMYICVYVCTYVFCLTTAASLCAKRTTSLVVHAFFYACMLVRVCMCWCVCVHVCMYVCMYVCPNSSSKSIMRSERQLNRMSVDRAMELPWHQCC